MSLVEDTALLPVSQWKAYSPPKAGAFRQQPPQASPAHLSLIHTNHDISAVLKKVPHNPAVLARWND